MRIDVPRDREGSFEPILIPKHERRFRGFDERIIAMYARGMSVREIQAFVAEQYANQVSPEFISSVTDEVMADASAWQSRPLEPMYPVVFFDASRVKIRTDGVVANKAVYLALDVLPDGTRDVLGLWIEQTEGAKFWLKVFNELKTRGCHDILIAVVDGLEGLAEAIGAVYPRTTVQTCLVHLIRASLEYASWKERQAAGRRAAPDLHRDQRRRRRGVARGVCRRPLGHQVPDDRAGLAQGVGACGAVFGLSSRDPARDLHDQRHRESEHAAQKDHQDPRPLPKRRGRHQTALAGHPERAGQDRSIGLRLETRDEPVRHPVRRALHACSSGLRTSSRSTASPTKRRTGPAT